MSFFSYLMLAANSGIKSNPEQGMFQQLCLDIGLTKETQHADYMYNLHPNIAALFRDEMAVKMNDRFFRPDTVSLNSTISISSFDAEYSYGGIGYQIGISGYGYFFPWNKAKLKALVELPPFSTLKQRCDEIFGGNLEIPSEAHMIFDEAIIAPSAGWTWLKSES